MSVLNYLHLKQQGLIKILTQHHHNSLIVKIKCAFKFKCCIKWQIVNTNKRETKRQPSEWDNLFVVDLAIYKVIHNKSIKRNHQPVT